MRCCGFIPLPPGEPGGKCRIVYTLYLSHSCLVCNSVFPDLSIEVWVNLDENSFAAGGPDLALPNSGFAVGCGDYATGLGRRAILLHDSHFSAIGRPHVAIDAGAPCVPLVRVSICHSVSRAKSTTPHEMFPVFIGRYLSNLDPLAPRNWHHIVAVWQQGGFSFVYV